MRVGSLVVFQNPASRGQSDADMYRHELKFADLAEPLGFDSLWSVEHHFTDYTLCPNPVTFAAYMAGRTQRIKLGTAAIILPWHKDPLRVASDIAMLDNLTQGRTLVGLGRGIGRVEYDGWGIDMNESRERWEESLEMILGALEKGRMESHEGKYFQQKVARELRPAPLGSLKERLFIVSISPDTVPFAAHYGGTLMTFAFGPWEQRAPDIERYRELYQKEHESEAPPTSANMFVYCHSDSAKAEDMAQRYMRDYWQSAIDHYEMGGEHFSSAKSYEYYAEAAKALREDLEGAKQGFVDLQLWGTPDQCLERIEAIRDAIGPIDINGCFSYAAMDYGEAEASMRLFAQEVLPVVKDW
jgi:alkanesulfonate monooxygenase SsuD/methylene tetrahydromethanopterin reductase-like flavin-dependent oxidoreductase (luciferase family)